MKLLTLSDTKQTSIRSAYTVNCCTCIPLLPVGSLTLAHGERTKAITLTAVADTLEPTSYAIHLTAATSTNSLPVAVKLR